MKTVKKPTKAHKGKNVLKAHQGMAHVPKQKRERTSGQPLVQVAPTKDFLQSWTGEKNPSFRFDTLPPRKQLRTLMPTVSQPPRPTVRPIIQSDAGGGRPIGIPRPIKELPNKGRRIIQRPPDSVVQVSPMPTVSQPQPKMDSRARRRRDNEFNSMIDEFRKNYNQPKIQYKKGGYVSRAKYGSASNLKK